MSEKFCQKTGFLIDYRFIVLKRAFIVSFFCLFTGLIYAEQEQSSSPLSTLDSSEVPYFQKLVEGNNRFAFNLYRNLKNEPGNLYFSPYALMAGLGMVAVGTKGATEDQFQKLFYYRLPLLLFIGDLNAALKNEKAQKNAFHMQVVNALWIDKSVALLPSFNQLQLRNFRVLPQAVDFSNDLSHSIEKINQWVSKEGSDRAGAILFGSLDVTTNTRMLLTTAVFLESGWQYPFEPKKTKRLSFQVSEFRSLPTEMMEASGRYQIFRGEDWDVLVCPFLQEKERMHPVMMIAMPKNGRRLEELENKLQWNDWMQWKESVQERLILVKIPHFRIEKRWAFDRSLKALGLTKIFSAGADFSAMTQLKNVFLNQALQKCSLQIDESGVNSILSHKMSQDILLEETGSQEAFVADRPFIFIIWDQKSDAILCMGRVVYP